MMVRNRHTAPSGIPEVGFAAPVGTPAGIEVISLAELRERAPGDSLTTPQRPDFHHLLTLTSGTLWHTVDFTAHALQPGHWLWVRPGQVHQWGDLTHAEGALILFQPGFLDPETTAAARLDDPFAPPVLLSLGEDQESLHWAADQLDREFHTRTRLPPDLHTTVLRHLLAVLVLRLAYLTEPAGSPAPEPGQAFLRFRDAVEHDHTRTRRVEDYAHTLGYSPRTLSRATLAAAGLNAKEFIDRRVVLEAKRLLAHTDQSAAQIADGLGFSSATNFSKYFHQRTGTTPIAFRTTTRGHRPG